MAYRLRIDGPYSGIERTAEVPDQYEVFGDLEEAQKALISYLSKQKRLYAVAIDEIRGLRAYRFKKHGRKAGLVRQAR